MGAVDTNVGSLEDTTGGVGDGEGVPIGTTGRKGVIAVAGRIVERGVGEDNGTAVGSDNDEVGVDESLVGFVPGKS